jgi:hypothetical protein
VKILVVALLLALVVLFWQQVVFWAILAALATVVFIMLQL